MNNIQWPDYIQAFLDQLVVEPEVIGRVTSGGAHEIEMHFKWQDQKFAITRDCDGTETYYLRDMPKYLHIVLSEIEQPDYTVYTDTATYTLPNAQSALYCAYGHLPAHLRKQR